MGAYRKGRKLARQGMVSMMSTGDPLNPRIIHDQVHNLVLSRRRGIAIWEGVFETAWAGYVIANHATENREEELLNSIKGMIVGERRIQSIKNAYDLASCYMSAAFLFRIGDTDDAIEYIELAETFVNENISHEEIEGRFHFYSTPEYIYAASLNADYALDRISSPSILALQQAAGEFYHNKWYGRSQVFATAGSAYLRLNGYSLETCTSLGNFALNYQAELIEEKISVLWFLETTWPEMRKYVLGNTVLQNELDSYLIYLRTQIFRVFPNFVTEPYDLEQSRLTTAEQLLERVASDRIVTTIELLMLDEVAERHAISSLVVTKEELARRDSITTIFDSYRQRVDAAIEKIGLTNTLLAIYQAVDSNNPASWSQAALSCRQVLYELSTILLQVPDKTYPHIKSKDGQPMSLAGNVEKNRLEAYMHQMGIRKGNPLLVEQLGSLSELMRILFDEAAATGKRRPSPNLEEVCSLVLNTYLFLGDLERLTGFEVVTELK